MERYHFLRGTLFISAEAKGDLNEIFIGLSFKGEGSNQVYDLGDFLVDNPHKRINLTYVALPVIVQTKIEQTDG